MRAPILLVEDDPSDIDLTRHAFRSDGAANEFVCLERGGERPGDRLGAWRFAARDVPDLPARTLLDPYCLVFNVPPPNHGTPA
ncbi:MAG: hypothetical protein AB7O32_16065 [Vicinamibacterales bacterium]